jgi:selenide,water dikinase
LDFPTDPNVIVGLERADDAGVYRITDDVALIQTVDFFTPVVDDPYWFGQIAAANALSDVYAMGGVPRTAMNLVAFPSKTMDLSVLRQIIQGGIDKMKEAEVALVGGHSIEDKEIKYGLSVTGIIHPDRVLTKKNLRPGDSLVLTKPLGTGIINTAIKAGMASDKLCDEVTRLMASLNRDAARIMAGYDISACTDVTGFGFLGHLAEMVSGSGNGMRIDAQRIPVIAEALELANMGFIPAGAYKNRDFRQKMILLADKVSRKIVDILFDPQTSGGLLVAVARHQADDFMAALVEAGMTHTAVVGDVLDVSDEKIWVE